MKLNLKLFVQVARGAVFYFHDKPKRLLIKSNKTHYVSPEGRRQAHPHVLVVEKEYKNQDGDNANTSA